MLPKSNISHQFQQLRRQYLTYCKQHPVPPAIHHKLMFLSDCILHETHPQSDEMDEVDPDQLQQLRQIDLDSQTRLFISIARCVMGYQPTDSLRDRQAFIRKDTIFSRWQKCLITTTSDKLLITQKQATEISFGQLRISNSIKVRNKKYSFLLEIRKKLFIVGSDHEKSAIHIHKIIKQLVMENTNMRKNSMDKESDLHFIGSEVLQTSISKDLDESQLDQMQNPKSHEQDQQLVDIEDESSFKLDQYVDNGRILRHQFKPNILKCFILINIPKTSNPNPCEQVLNIFMNFKEWNTEIDKYIVVSKPDADTYVIYQKYRKSGIMTLPRDYVTIKKAKKLSNEKFSLTEQSIEHRDYPTEYLSVRGSVKRVSMFEARQVNHQKLVLLVTQIEVTGNEEDVAVGIRYLKSYDKFPSYCVQKLMLDAGQRFFMFDTLKIKKSPAIKFMSLQDHVPKSPPTVPTLTLLELTPTSFDSPISEQFALQVRANQHFHHHIRQRYSVQPYLNKGILMTRESDFFFQKGEWALNSQQQMIFVNQEVIDAQKDIIKYILKQIGTNLLSGKSVMDMSLPVQIFDDRSILQRTATSYGYAVQFLGKAGQSKSLIEQIKLTSLFILSLPLLQMRLQKPFNPLLGETFQGYIGGVPIYMQQISHHPPISAFLMKCDSFELYGSTLVKAQMHFNSVTGINIGAVHIHFPKTDTKLKCYMPSVDISGLLYGERKFKIVNKAFIICETEKIVCELAFGKEKPGVYTWVNKTKRLTSSSVIGGIYKVGDEFFQRFNKQTKKHKFEGIQKKEIIEKFMQAEGYWNGDIIFDGEVCRKLYEPLPHTLQYQTHPLASNSNYREDIIYKRMRRLELANAKKAQLENIQRRDKKMRIQYNHHRT